MSAHTQERTVSLVGNPDALDAFVDMLTGRLRIVTTTPYGVRATYFVGFNWENATDEQTQYDPLAVRASFILTPYRAVTLHDGIEVAS